MLHLILSELADLASQIVTVERGAITLHLDRATLGNVAAQLRHALAGA